MLLRERDARRRAEERHEPLEERDAEAARLRRGGEHGGRQLEVIAREHRAVGAQEREVERGLDRLRRLVHHREREPAAGERRARRAR